MDSSANKPQPTVVLVGRINVGKSTLFNRLVGDKIALTSAIPGTTRDRREANVEWRDVNFTLVDTGGVESALSRKLDRGKFQPLITEQTEAALSAADLALVVVNAKDGILPQDQSWAERVRGYAPIILAVNKVDNAKRESSLADFYQLGLGEPHPVSAINGRASGDLLDVVVEALKKQKGNGAKRSMVMVNNDDAVKLAILGQPNAGKSSLINAMLGKNRVIISEIPHTTREPQDIPLKWKGQNIVLIDTAGARRQRQKSPKLEASGVEASLKSAEASDVIVLVIDVTRGPTFQDQRLAKFAREEGRGLVLVVNKWDLIKDKTPKRINEIEREFRRQLPGLNWATMIFVSATTKQRVAKIMESALLAAINRQRGVEESDLISFQKRAARAHHPSRGGGVKHPKILAFKQLGIMPPHFELTIEGELHPSYLKFLENRLRREYDFTGTPIHIRMRKIRKRVRK